MPFVVTQLPSVYGKKSQSNRSSLYDRYAIGLLLGKEGYAVMMHPQLKINDYYLTLPLVTLYCMHIDNLHIIVCNIVNIFSVPPSFCLSSIMLNVRPQGWKIANATPYFPSFTDGK